MLITKMSLPRRTFLRGMGTTLALPLLDAMVPALSAMRNTAANPVRRFGAVYVGNGANMSQWTPATLPPADPRREARFAALIASDSRTPQSRRRFSRIPRQRRCLGASYVRPSDSRGVKRDRRFS